MQDPQTYTPLRDIDPTTLHTRNECLDAIDQCSGAIADMQAQIDIEIEHKEVYGAYSDPDWWRRVHCALSKSKALRQRLHARLGEINREERVRQSISRANQFVDAARRILPEGIMQRIWDDVDGASINQQ